MAARGAPPTVRVLLLAVLLATFLCAQQVAADSTITNLSTRGKVYVNDKELRNGATVTIKTAKLGNVKLARRLNGPFGLLPLKDRRSFYVVNNNVPPEDSFPSDFIEGRFITNAF